MSILVRPYPVDLFAYALRYPYAPRHRAGAPETSAQAAQSVTSSARTLRDSVLARLRKDGPLTADECAERLGESVLATRPRLSELRRLGKIRDSGGRRQNSSGRSAAVWEIKI